MGVTIIAEEQRPTPEPNYYLDGASINKIVEIIPEPFPEIEIDLSQVSVYDLIEGQNIPLLQYLTHNPTNIVFMVDNVNATGMSRDNLSKQMRNFQRNVLYACRTEEHNVYNGPYLNGISIGLHGLISYSQLKYLLSDSTIKVVRLKEIDFTNYSHRVMSSSHTSIVSMRRLNCHDNYTYNIYELEKVKVFAGGMSYNKQSRRRRRRRSGYRSFRSNSLHRKTNKMFKSHKIKKSRNSYFK
jgi:hypothetical protein